ncbi:hypothetical protein D770_12645 [Flammeovirgaceae bacterium 311]|nr:hypothetical protein D770_12645 [Flammeovirgaceae bacterium 311]
MRYLFAFILLILSYSAVYGQKNISISTPVIWSTFQVPNNWSPPTAVHRQNEFNGTAAGHGVNITYSFKAPILIKSEHLQFVIGGGYFKQRFDIIRPFDYVSILLPIFYTHHYSYYSLQGILGVTYNHSIGKNWFLSGNLSYNWLYTFRQEYTPSSNHGYGKLTQVNKDFKDFGNMLNFSAGINRKFGTRLSLGVHILAPLHTRWRNDRIFKDNPNTTYSPKSSLGSQLSVTYHLKQKPQKE